jgi:hypothetical protein
LYRSEARWQLGDSFGVRIEGDVLGELGKGEDEMVVLKVGNEWAAERIDDGWVGPVSHCDFRSGDRETDSRLRVICVV